MAGHLRPQQPQEPSYYGLQHRNRLQNQRLLVIKTEMGDIAEQIERHLRSEAGPVIMPRATNSHRPAPLPQDEPLFWFCQMSDEIKEMLLAVEDAIERNIISAFKCIVNLKTQKLLLNLCYYVTHNCPINTAALSWLIENAKLSIEITIRKVMLEDPFQIPPPLVEYLQGIDYPSQMFPSSVPPQYAPMSNAFPQPSPPDQKFRHSSGSEASAVDSPTEEKKLQSSSWSQPETNCPLSQQLLKTEPQYSPEPVLMSATTAYGPPVYNYLSPTNNHLFSHVEQVMPTQPQDAAAYGPFFQSSQPHDVDAGNLPEAQEEAEELLPCNLKNGMTNIDWWHLRGWIKFLKQGIPIENEALVWMILCIVREQRKFITQ